MSLLACNGTVRRTLRRECCWCGLEHSRFRLGCERPQTGTSAPTQQDEREACAPAWGRAPFRLEARSASSTCRALSAQELRRLRQVVSAPVETDTPFEAVAGSAPHVVSPQRRQTLGVGSRADDDRTPSRHPANPASRSARMNPSTRQARPRSCPALLCRPRGSEVAASASRPRRPEGGV